MPCAPDQEERRVMDEFSAVSPTSHRVAITVFTTAEGVDLGDASAIAKRAVWRALAAANTNPDGWTIIAQFSDEPLPVQIHDVIDTGMAAGNGYLWLEPTAKAYHERRQPR